MYRASSILLAAFIAAQQPGLTIKVDVPYVAVDVAVSTADGRPVTTLTEQDFTIYEDGRPQRLANFTPVAAPYSILLMFDRSASTKGQWDFMKSAIARFIRDLRPQDTAAIAAFDKSFKMLSDWRSAPDKISAALDKLAAEESGETAFYDSLQRGVAREFRNVAGRRAIIVFTDGRDSQFYKRTIKEEKVPALGPDRDFQQTLRTVRDSRIPVYFIAMNTDLNLGDPPGGDYLNLRRVYSKTDLADSFLHEVRVRIEQLAAVSGGRVFFPRDLQSVATVYDQIRREFATFYSLAYVSDAPPSVGESRRIEVRIKGDGLRVSQSREGYEAR